MEAKVSIIVPIYNMESYLEKCIESIREQSYKNIEIILINDGSIDKSEDICKKYQIKDCRIKLISSKNKGVSNARNLGIEASTGEYISFVDPDDTIDERYIEELLFYMKKHFCDVVFCLERDIYPELNKIYNIKLKDERLLSNNFYKDFYLIAEKFHAPWGKLYKSNIIKKYNIRFPIDMVVSEDHIFNQEYLKHVKKYGFLNKNLYNYYKRKNNSAAQNVSEKYFLSEMENLRRKKEFLNNELLLVDEKEKNIYLLKYTKIIISKFLSIENINKYELKKLKLRLTKIKEIISLDDIFMINMNLKEYMYIIFLKKNMWMGIYILGIIKYLKNYMKNKF
ncbi:glycosyltransferase family 2 protein [Megamonas funiformis]|nr:glycosyltransferase family 2 protein [Megamonas funiformis]